MFSEKQIKELEAPLNSKNVKQRQQSGRSLSYIEGWHAIAEANRIFGFDGWSRETVDFRCVSERERAVRDTQGWGVTYIAKVRIMVCGFAREGCGTGHGIDRDLGQAHESALKEAETDAMKRALMTFGNPFGLALYDKEQVNVVTDEPVTRKPAPAAKNVMKDKTDDFVPSASEYAKQWATKIETATDDSFAKEWKDQTALRDKMSWPSEDFRRSLGDEVAKAVQFMRAGQ